MIDMGKINVKTTMAVTILLALALGPIITGTTLVAAAPDDAALPNVTPLLPKDSMLDHFIRNFPEIVGNMEDAEIEGTHVYYFTFDSVQKDAEVIHRNDEDGQFNYTTQEILNFFSDVYNNLSLWQTNISNLWANPNFAGLSDAWTHKAWKETTIRDIMAWAMIDNNTITNDDAGLAEFIADTSEWYWNGDWASASPEEIYWFIDRNVTPSGMFTPIYMHELANKSISSVLDLNVSYILGQTLPTMNDAKLELEGHAAQKLFIDYDIFVNVTEQVDLDDKAVVIMWDPDDSVMTQVNRIKNRQRPNAQAFTGNEVFYGVHFMTTNRTLWGDVDIDIAWNYTNGNPAPKFYEFMNKYRFSPRFLHWVSEASEIPIYLLSRFVRPSYQKSVSAAAPVEFSYGKFEMSSLKVNSFELKFDAGLLKAPTEVNIDLVYGEHDWLGLTVYNDTNGNGYQDVEIKGTAPFLYAETDESLYRFRPTSVETRNYTAPSVVGNSLVFGIEFLNVDGELVPHDQAEEEMLLNQTAGNVQEHIDKVAFMFNFSVNTTAKAADMKVDYIFGEFEDPSTGTRDTDLDGYELALNTRFTAFRYRAGLRTFNETTRILQGDGTDQIQDPEQVRKLSRFRFQSGTTVDFDNRLDDIPYQWGTAAEDVNATGQLIPLGLGKVAFGRATTEGNTTIALGQSLSGGVFIYSVSYPKWDGKTIVHDPVFTTFVGDLGTTVGGGLFDGDWKWILIGAAGIVGVIVVVALVRRGRGSSYPYPGRQIPGTKEDTSSSVEEKPRSDAWHYISSLFFSNSGSDSQTQLNPRNQITFEFITSFLAFNLFALTTRQDGAWELVQKELLVPEEWSEETNRDFQKVLFNPPIYDSSRTTIQKGTGVAYLFQNGNQKTPLPVSFIDVFYKPHQGRLARLVIPANSVPTEEVWPSLQAIFDDLLFYLETSIARPQENPYKKFLEIFQKRIPMDLCKYHRVDSSESETIVDEIDQIPDLFDGDVFSKEDMREIRADLDNLSKEQAMRILKKFEEDYKKMFEE